MNAPLLEVEGLTKTFPLAGGFLRRSRGGVQAVADVSFSLAAGETLAIVGESGCGKSTTGRALMRLLEPSAGRVTLDGTDITALGPGQLQKARREMQMIFQDPFGSLNPRMTVFETLAEPLALHGLARGAAAKARVAELLETVGLSAHHADRFPHEFSGGQRQRICIARALATKPRLIVCDEAVSALDVSVQAQIINLLQDLQRAHGMAYVFISHDLSVVRHISDRVAVMYLGRVVEEAPTASLFATPRHPYTRLLLAAAPRPVPGLRQPSTGPKGEAPSALAPPPGCAFHPRCPLASDICRRERPAPRALGHSTVACHHAEQGEASAALAVPPMPQYMARRQQVLARARNRQAAG